MISAFFFSETVAPTRSSKHVWACLGAMMLPPETAHEIPRGRRRRNVGARRSGKGECQVMTKKMYKMLLPTLLCLAPLAASAQSFRVQCPPSTITHPVAANNNSEHSYVGPTYTGTSGFPAAPAHVNGAIKCQQISGGDGYATMDDGTQTNLFSFGPLSGLAKLPICQPGTGFPTEVITIYTVPMTHPGD